MQENTTEIPAGGMPRSVDVILRNSMVDEAKPGDSCIFTGILIVVPDVVTLLRPGERPKISYSQDTVRHNNMTSMDGVSGLSMTGVKELNYKMIFLAQHIKSSEDRLFASEGIE